MRTIQDILHADAARLNKALDLGAATARIEVQCLLQHILKVPRSYLLAHSEQTLDVSRLLAYDTLLQRRMQGEPVAYILGEREFFGLHFRVSPDTLIPRPETELLVELALERIPVGRQFRVLDLGTGSGAIAISIAHGRPGADVMAVDASQAALEMATENARQLGVANTTFLHSDWFSALAGQRYNLIVSNPPYVAAGDSHLSVGDVRFEPLSALASGMDGLDDIRRIATRAGDFLERDAWILLEHGYDQAVKVRSILRGQGFAEVMSASDIAGIERVSGGRMKK